MKLFYPMPSKEHKDHYYTFLDMCTKKPEELPNADTHLPSYDKNLGNCPHCPDFVFLSKTAKKRHLQVFHPKKRSVVWKKSSQSAEKRFKCIISYALVLFVARCLEPCTSCESIVKSLNTRQIVREYLQQLH